MSENPELARQNQKFGYKAPESVYHKHDPKASLVGSGKWEQTSITMVYVRRTSEKVLHDEWWMCIFCWTHRNSLFFYYILKLT